MNGTLALVGSGEYLPPMDPVDKKLLERIGKPPEGVPAHYVQFLWKVCHGRNARGGNHHSAFQARTA